MVACPFEVPAYEYNEPLHPRVRKCTMCFVDKIAKGETPACVQACPKQVMTFGKRNELIDFAHDKIRRNPETYVNHVYGEKEVGGTCWMYLSGVPFDFIGMRTDLGETPYPELTLGFLSTVPVVLTVWPVLFSGIYLFTRRRNELANPDPHQKTIAQEEGR
jgi:hypothetical protein